MLRGIAIGTGVNVLLFPSLLLLSTGNAVPDGIMIGLVFLAVYYIAVNISKEYSHAN